MTVAKKFSDKIISLIISSSIINTIKTSHIIIIVLLFIPLILTITVTLLNTINYDKLINNVEKANQLNQIVKTEITGELWDIIAGNRSFDDGFQYLIIKNTRSQMAEIMQSIGENPNRRLLEVADRSMNTLTHYVDRLGMQMEQRYPV